MRGLVNIFLLLSVILKCHAKEIDKGRPHIVFIVADDAGWNDFSFHGSPQIPTPNIDTLALTGTVLNSYYGSPLCTPSRGSILTGKHAIHIRLQHFVIMGGSAEGLPLEEKLLPQYLKELNYSTHLVGKWHLGHSRKAYTPTYRGFDSHFGYWLGKQDYYGHMASDEAYYGYDLRRNLTVDFEPFGQYNTDIFTNEAVNIIKHHDGEKSSLFLMITHQAPHRANEYMPLQAPLENVEKFASSIKKIGRRRFAGMVDKLDESVGKVVEALGEAKMLQNSIIVFVSDNGGAPEGFDMNHGSNWPLRGAKNTLWEGGTRLSSFIWSPFIMNRVSNDLMHVQDWLPTIYEAIGGDVKELEGIDGMSLWNTFVKNDPSPRKSFLYNIDDIYNNSAVRVGNWKLIQGITSPPDIGGKNWDAWYGPSGRSRTKTVLDLIPLIVSSQAANALTDSGILIRKSTLKDMQRKSELTCVESSIVACDAFNHPCLFDIMSDPCEKINLANQYPLVVEELLDVIQKFNRTALTPISTEWDPQSDPANWNYIWVPWKDYV